MKNNFEYALQQVLKDEGGYGNNPADRGGPTNFGITIGDYRKYINKNGTADDVRNMKVSDAGTIYKKNYWDACSCDSLPSGVDYTVFDYAVNSGVSRSLRVYKQFLDKTPEDCVNAINDERLSFLKSLSTRPGQDQFLRGWTNRVSRVRAKSLALVSKPGPVHTGAAAGAGAVIASGAVAAASVPHHYWSWIAAGVGFVLVTGFIAYLIHKHSEH